VGGRNSQALSKTDEDSVQLSRFQNHHRRQESARKTKKATGKSVVYTLPWLDLETVWQGILSFYCCALNSQSS
jgi:hypothetical protein